MMPSAYLPPAEFPAKSDPPVVQEIAAETLDSREALHRRNAELERLLAERTAQLDTTRKELETLSFSISHDLRSPLRGIDGFVRKLLEQHAFGLDAEGLRLLHVVRSETRRMGQLIDDILAFSRVSRQDMDATSIDMADLARCTFQQLLENSANATATLEVGELPPGCGDRSMLRQVFVNLLGNAIKFSRRQAAPLIEVTGHLEEGRVVYRVKDNGVGFDPRYAHRLFGVFQRLHSQNDFEGTGIGLALVQRIIHRHGGTVWAEGAIDAGASFYFSLPLRAPSRART